MIGGGGIEKPIDLGWVTMGSGDWMISRGYPVDSRLPISLSNEIPFRLTSNTR